METLKFITQTTNYKDNELSLIAERITPSLLHHHPLRWPALPSALGKGLHHGNSRLQRHGSNWCIRINETSVALGERSFAFSRERSSAHVFGPRLGNYIKKRFWSLTFSRRRRDVSSGVVVQKFNVLTTESSNGPGFFSQAACATVFLLPFSPPPSTPFLLRLRRRQTVSHYLMPMPARATSF